MGRGIRHSKNKKNKNRGDRPQKERQDNGVGYKELVRESSLFESFYKAQIEVCPPEEFDQMFDYLKRDLPASFRVTGFRSQAVALRNFIQSHYFRQLTDLADKEDAEAVQDAEPHHIVRPNCIKWYPESMAWQLNLTRKDIRRQEIYFKLHNFLISETESGNISRQESVSMIPPLVLDVKPHHKVLDMCAAPGSKTAQLIEALHAQEGTLPEGVVIANDADNARCYMLVHQAKRLQSPCMLVTNHDASCMPNISVTNVKTGEKSNMKFDRILCDVPCTGDGTLRKNADIWPKWNAANAANLHGIQYRIVKRAAELLAVGGRMVYSTCSLNPMEDEAVLCKLLAETGDSVELVEASGMVPGLVFRQGVSNWIVSDKMGNHFKKFSEVPEKVHSLLRPSMFPPEPEEAAKFNLDRCMRILPHQQDTGGFFVAVLEKKKLCPWESARKADHSNGNAEGWEAKNGNGRSSREPPKKKRRFQGYKEDPFLFFEDNDAAFNEIKEYFKLKEGIEAKMFLTRCKDVTKKNSLYYTSMLVRDIVLSNIDRVKIINTGVKAFVKCENKGADSDFRLAQEGALMTIPFLGHRVVRVTKKDLEILLSFSDFDHPPALGLLEQESQDKFNEFPTGSIAIVYDDDELKLGIVGWKGKLTIRAYVPRNERLHYLRLIGADTTPFEVNKFQGQRAEEQKSDQKDFDEDMKQEVFEIDTEGTHTKADGDGKADAVEDDV